MTPLQTWNSKLFPRIHGKYVAKTVSFNGRDWSLDDYSYTGYFLGARSPGTVAGFVHDVAAAGDISAALQSAIDTAGRAGGGIVRIPAGSFTMSEPVQIPYDNVSIEGAGSGQTTITVPATYPSRDPSFDGLFTFGKTFQHPNDNWIDNLAVITKASAIVLRGDSHVTTSDASSINPGDWIIVQQYFWQKLVDDNSTTPNKWPVNNSDFSFTYLRSVTGKTGNVIQLDAPVPWTLDPAHNTVNVKSPGQTMHENVGIKGLTIQFENNATKTSRAHGTAVFFDGVRNGWIVDVEVVNFPRNGLYLHFCARITVLDSRVNGAQDTGGNGYGYGFLVAYSQNVLIKRCHGSGTRHNFISSRTLVSTLAQTQCVSLDAADPDDTHFAFEQAILWDRHTQAGGEALHAFNRGNESNGAYETLGSGVVWNFSGDGVGVNSKGIKTFWGGEVHLKPSPYGEAIMVGGPGRAGVFDNSNYTLKEHGDAIPPFVGLQVGSNGLKNVLYEGLGRTGLEPASLYEAQLANRF